MLTHCDSDIYIENYLPSLGIERPRKGIPNVLHIVSKYLYDYIFDNTFILWGNWERRCLAGWNLPRCLWQGKSRKRHNQTHGNSIVNFLEQRILKDGLVYPGNVLSVDSFLNHQIDVALYQQIGDEFYRRFAKEKIDKILTIESSGIGIACITAERFHVPVLFAKKAKTSNIADDQFVSEVVSYTHHCSNRVLASKKYLHPGERILIVDDFLATGSAVFCMLDLLKQAQCIPVGIGIVIEKGFQPGGAKLRSQGYHLESLAIVESMDCATGKITFRENPKSAKVTSQNRSFLT